MIINNIIKKSIEKIKDKSDQKKYNDIFFFDLTAKIDFLNKTNMKTPRKLLESVAIEIHAEGFRDKWTKNKIHAQLTEKQTCDLLEKSNFNKKRKAEYIFLPDKGIIDQINPLKSNWIKTLYKKPSITLYNTFENNGFFNNQTNIDEQLIKKLIEDNLLFYIFFSSFEKDYKVITKNNLHDVGDNIFDDKEKLDKKEERTQIIENMMKLFIKNNILIQEHAEQFNISYDKIIFSSKFLKTIEEKIKMEQELNINKKTNKSKVL